MRNLDGPMTGWMTGRMDGEEDQHQHHRTDEHHEYYYVGDRILQCDLISHEKKSCKYDLVSFNVICKKN
jgi:hypothetical protein